MTDPSRFLGDSQIKPWYRNRRVDLTAPNTPISNAGRFLIFKEEVTKGQAVVVKGIVPYAMARENVGSDQERAVYITPVQGNGYFSFEPEVEGGSPFDLLLDVNAPQLAVVGGVASVTLNNDDRQKSKGITEISDTPLRDAGVLWTNPLFTFDVLGGTTLSIWFELLTNIKNATTSPVTDTFLIDALGADDTQRVDYAGCLIVGEIMPENLLKRLAELNQARNRGIR